MNLSFWLHNFDTWTEQPINANDLGRRCRGNIQIHRLTSTGGLLVFVHHNRHWDCRANFYMPDLPYREAYKVAWRLKRLLERYGPTMPIAGHNGGAVDVPALRGG